MISSNSLNAVLRVVNFGITRNLMCFMQGRSEQTCLPYLNMCFILVRARLRHSFSLFYLWGKDAGPYGRRLCRTGKGDRDTFQLQHVEGESLRPAGPSDPLGR